MARTIGAVLVGLLLASCSAVKSVEVPPADRADGLTEKGQPPEPACAIDGDHTFIYKSVADAKGATPCGITIDVTGGQGAVLAHSKTRGEEYSGVFYRQNLVYTMTAKGRGANVAAIVLSPSESKTHFLPVSKTFFSNNAAEFVFVDGVPQKYKEETEGELVALLKIPAEVLTAYFAAIGAVFDAFKTNDSKEAAALTEQIKLELAKKKYEACIAAIKANDDARVKELNCQQ